MINEPLNMQKDFQDSYRSTQWQEKKNKILTRDNYTCQLCGKHGDEHTLMHVHHITYRNCKNGKAWNCPDEDLVTLCETCHTKVHSGIPYSNAEQNYYYYNKMGNFLSHEIHSYRLTLHSFDDGMAECLTLTDKDNKKQYVAFHNGEILPPKKEDIFYEELPEPCLIFKPACMSISTVIKTIFEINANKDPFAYEEFLIKNFVEDIPWEKDCKDDEKSFISALIVYSLLGDERLQDFHFNKSVTPKMLKGVNL